MFHIRYYHPDTKRWVDATVEQLPREMRIMRYRRVGWLLEEGDDITEPTFDTVTYQLLNPTTTDGVYVYA